MHFTMWLPAGGLENHMVSFILTLLLFLVNLITIFSVCEKITSQGNDKQKQDSFRLVSILKFILHLFLKIVKAHTYLFKRYFPPITLVDVIMYIPILTYRLHYTIRALKAPLSLTGFGQPHLKPPACGPGSSISAQAWAPSADLGYVVHVSLTSTVS